MGVTQPGLKRRVQQGEQLWRLRRWLACLTIVAGALIGAAAAHAEASQPSVETKAATSVTETGATLKGIVNPNGAETKYSFEYGTTESYGSKTAEATAGSGTSNVEESKAITGLTASTTYHFRIVATNSHGTTDGSDEVFSTGQPFVETKAATSGTETEATLNGTVNPNGAETKYFFEYGTTESYGSKTAEATAGSGTSNVEESKAITGLTASTTYHFRMVATNSRGVVDGSDEVLSTTGKPSAETKAPTSVTETGAALNGTVNPRGAETKYFFEYGTTESYGSKTAEATAGSGTSNVEKSKAITGLTASTTYHFRIVATNSHGTTDGSDEVFTTGQPFVETKAATSLTETGATLKGTVNPNGATTKYFFEYGTTESYGSKTAEASAGSGTSNVEESKAITGLTASTTYHFRMVATNSRGVVDGSDEVLSTTGKPSAETKAATAVSETVEALKGTVNPRGVDTKYYFEYGPTKSYGSKTSEATAGFGTSEESNTITGLTAGIAYHFRIVATNSHGTADGSDEVFATIVKPSVETKAATSVTETGATLNGAADPNGAETKYSFEYGTTETYGSKTAEATAGSGTSYVEESKAITGLTGVPPITSASPRLTARVPGLGQTRSFRPRVNRLRRLKHRPA